MIVVSDTSPINYLIVIGLIDLLPQLYGPVIIPNAVYSELCNPAAPRVVSEWTANLPSWVEVRTVAHPDPNLLLGAGEREAITLALELNADALLMDERKGRSEAISRGLTVCGTLNVLDTAAERDLIMLPRTIEKLLQTGFRASENLIGEMLKRDAERSASVEKD